MKPLRIVSLPAVLAVALLAACGDAENAGPPAPQEIVQGTACSLDGMLLADYPGPKAQIQYAGQAEPDFFCDTVEMFQMYLRPEQVRPVRALFVQDMGQADWDEPRGHWIDARQAYYVHGSRRHGSMGPTLASFAGEKAAADFAARHGGKVYAFAEVTPDMVALDGGTLHDSSM